MSPGRLSSRLSRIREQQKSGKPGDGALSVGDGAASVPAVKAEAVRGEPSGRVPIPPDGASRPAPGALAGWTPVADHLYERVDRSGVPGYRGRLSAHFSLLFPRERDFLESTDNLFGILDSLVFFDLETTGLSHGTGTVAFMAALGRLDGEGTLKVTQLLIDDYPGEAAFLDRFVELAGEDPVLVSFNGKGFDSQILQTRFLMNAMRPRFLAAPHLDLLYPARRLWKRELVNCRLGTIEAGIFDAPRVDDLPGSEAPDAWFEYLRGASPERLLAVGEHNLEDAKTLARLFFELDRRIETAEGRAGLIRALDLRAGRDYAGAEAFLAPLAASGDPIAARMLAIDAEHRLDKLDLALELARSLEDDARAERILSKLDKKGRALP